MKIWEERCRAKIQALRDAKPNKGKMPHWSTMQMRCDPNGKSYGQSHIVKPQHSDVHSDATLCGWHTASFRAAARFNLPSAVLYSIDDLVSPGNGGISPVGVGCPVCYAVLRVIGSQIDKGTSTSHLRSKATHLKWDEKFTACGVRVDRHTYSPSTFPKPIEHTPVVCLPCQDIYNVLWGPQRPELAYSSYTTNEEAMHAATLYGIDKANYEF